MAGMLKACQLQQMIPDHSFKGTSCYTARMQRFGAAALMVEIAAVLYLAGHVLRCEAMASLEVCLYLSLWAVMLTGGSGVLAVTTDMAGRPGTSIACRSRNAASMSAMLDRKDIWSSLKSCAQSIGSGWRCGS